MVGHVPPRNHGHGNPGHDEGRHSWPSPTDPSGNGYNDCGGKTQRNPSKPEDAHERVILPTLGVAAFGRNQVHQRSTSGNDADHRAEDTSCDDQQPTNRHLCPVYRPPHLLMLQPGPPPDGPGSPAATVDGVAPVDRARIGVAGVCGITHRLLA